MLKYYLGNMITKFLNLILILVFLSSCSAEKITAKSIIESTVSTGISKNPKSKSTTKKKSEN